MSLLCIPLGKDLPPLFVPGYEHPHYSQRCHVDVDSAVVNPAWTKLLTDCDLVFDRLELFYGPPDTPYTLGIHIDNGPGDRGKINWVFGGAGCTMHWYKVISNFQKPMLDTPVGSKYNVFDPNEVKLLSSITTIPENPTVVQVGIPHNIVNPGEERWCYSMVISDPATRDNVTFGRLKRVFGK
jgi:hypothetical protein